MKTYARVCVAAIGLGVAGCAPKQSPKPKVEADARAESATSSRGSAPKRGVALPVEGPAPDWELRDLNGQLVKSAAFKGKIVVLDFWATWCPPCRSEIPGYVDLFRKYGKDLAIVGVSLDEGGPGVVRDFVRKFGVNYTVVMGDDAVQNAYGATEAIPTTILIDRDGRIRDRKVGAEETAEYEKKIVSLLN